jgi:hypothetical protein
MSHHEKDGPGHDYPDREEHGKDGSTDHPDTEVTSEDEQDTASGGPPERP